MSTTLQAVRSELQPAGADLILQEWTPDALQEAINRETKLRSMIVNYCKKMMIKGHHFFNLPGQETARPSLSKQGALNLCSLFKVIPSPDEPKETLEANGHYTVRSRVHLVSLRTGAVVATGDGLCTTRESKYAYRWAWESEVPSHLDRETLERKEGEKKNGGTWVKFKLPNEDLADLYNVVLKMSAKRAMVDATLKLPLVSELFTQDLEEQIEQAVEEKAQTTRYRNNAATNGTPRPAPAAPSKKGRALDLRKVLIEKHQIGEDETLAALPEGVMTFEELTEEQCADVIVRLSNWINALREAERAKGKQS